MEMRPDLQIQTAIKAMTENVLPAVDPDDQLAQQSAQLTVGTLALLAEHLPYQYRYDCDELARLVATAEQIVRETAGAEETAPTMAELSEVADVGTEVLERAKADPAELLDAIQRLRAVASESVRVVFASSDEPVQQAVQRIVLDSARSQLLRDRSWLLTQGWEPDADSVPSIDSLLAVPPAKGE